MRVPSLPKWLQSILQQTIGSPEHTRKHFARDFVQKSHVKFLVRRSCGTLLWDPLVGHSSRETSSKTLTSSLQSERFVRDFLQKSRVKSPKRALRTSPKRAFRTRPPPKVTCQVSKTSVSYETSSKTHMSKPAKRGFRTRLPPKVQRKHPSEHTQFRESSPSKQYTRSHANPNVTATFTSTIPHDLTIPCACHESFRIHTSNARKVLRLPRNVTSVTPRNHTISCTCHENRTSTRQNQHKVLRLPRKVTTSSHVSFDKICTTPHV